MRRTVILVGLLVLVVTLSGCNSDSLSSVFDVDNSLGYGEARVVARSVGVDYNFRGGFGEYQGEELWLHGATHRQDSLSFLVRRVLKPRNFTRINGLEITLWNQGRAPLTIYPSQFSLHSPDGRQYSYSYNHQSHQRIYADNSRALLVSETIQPDQVRTIHIYFETGDRNIADENWTLGYTSRDSGFFRPSTSVMVLARPVWSTEPISR